MENIPGSGGVIIVPNHVSHFDPLVIAHYVYGAGRWPRFLGKASLWRVAAARAVPRQTPQSPLARGRVGGGETLGGLGGAMAGGGAAVHYPAGTPPPGAR